MATGDRVCAGCGEPVNGSASVWTATAGEKFYCHPDDPAARDCYHLATVHGVPDVGPR